MLTPLYMLIITVTLIHVAPSLNALHGFHEYLALPIISEGMS